MGTRWRGLLAPIDESTGDGRRLARGGGSWRPLPFALKWQRVDTFGHDDSVIIGATDTMNIGTVAQAIDNNWIAADRVKGLNPDMLGAWAAGDLFDDVDPDELPRLAEDIAEAKLLLDRQVIGPSIDPDQVTVATVRKGSDKPLTWDEIDMLLWECEETGVDPSTVLETLYVTWRIDASTLVVIPAFAECRPFELGPFEGAAPAEGDTEPADSGALLASLTAAAREETQPVVPIDIFTVPPADRVHAIEIHDRGDGWLRLAGYVAAASTCHVEFRDACVTPPQSQADYALFHRFAAQTDEGLLSVGRITTGLGRIGTGCGCCRGKDDHACSQMSLVQAIEHYDRLNTLAYVRVQDSPLGAWACGYVKPGATPEELAVLNRCMVSGDWRESGGNLELIEVLALATGRPGFPVPILAQRSGRAYSLTAAGGVIPGRQRPHRTPAPPDMTAIAGQAAQLVMDRLAAEGIVKPAATEAVTAASGHTGAMIALRMSEVDAYRLVTDDYEPVEELHMTLLFLGTAEDISADRQAAILDAVREFAAGLDPVTGNVFGVSVFNPTSATDLSTDALPAITLNVSGPDLGPLQEGLATAVRDQFAYPDQYAPWSPHVTLAYSTDYDLVGQFADRVGPVTFDRIRVAFAGVVTDIPLGQAGALNDPTSLAAEVEAALSQLDAPTRAREADELAREIEEMADV